jgi:methionine-R-sulfoxide reductase
MGEEKLAKAKAPWLSYRRESDEEARSRLTPTQFAVMREAATERPFENEYWNESHEGLYVDRLSGEPLFSSKDKFDSGCGWPSFSKPLGPDGLLSRPDSSHGMRRIEVRSIHSDSHLGHVFDDGPEPMGLRYCINSASIRFIAREDLATEGYEEYESLFLTE